MQQLDLFTKKPARYEFRVTFYVDRNIATCVEIDKNDKRSAIFAAKNKLRLEYYQQAAAFLMSSPPKALLEKEGLFKLATKPNIPKSKKLLRAAGLALAGFLV